MTERGTPFVPTVVLILMGLSLSEACSETSVRERSSSTPTPSPTASVSPAGPNWVAPKCSIDIKHSPSLKGLHLGMTIDEVRLIRPLIKVGSNDELGVTTVGQSAFRYGHKEKQNYGVVGVENIHLKFLDNRLALIEIVYSDIGWKTQEEFLTEFSKLLNLPTGAWQEETWNPPKGVVEAIQQEYFSQDVLDCRGFQIGVRFLRKQFEGYPIKPRFPAVRISDYNFAGVVNQRREKQDEIRKPRLPQDGERKQFEP